MRGSSGSFFFDQRVRTQKAKSGSGKNWGCGGSAGVKGRWLGGGSLATTLLYYGGVARHQSRREKAESEQQPRASPHTTGGSSERRAGYADQPSSPERAKRGRIRRREGRSRGRDRPGRGPPLASLVFWMAALETGAAAGARASPEHASQSECACAARPTRPGTVKLAGGRGASLKPAQKRRCGMPFRSSSVERGLARACRVPLSQRPR